MLITQDQAWLFLTIEGFLFLIILSLYMGAGYVVEIAKIHRGHLVLFAGAVLSFLVVNVALFTVLPTHLACP